MRKQLFAIFLTFLFVFSSQQANRILQTTEPEADAGEDAGENSGISCNVVGCEKCNIPNICSDCLDDHGASIIAGKCECKLFY